MIRFQGIQIIKVQTTNILSHEDLTFFPAWNYWFYIYIYHSLHLGLSLCGSFIFSLLSTCCCLCFVSWAMKLCSRREPGCSLHTQVSLAWVWKTGRKLLQETTSAVMHWLSDGKAKCLKVLKNCLEEYCDDGLQHLTYTAKG